MAIWKKAAQLSQEYNDMRTEDGGTRGKFTEMVMDVKYDAWVIERYSAGIIPIIDIKNMDAKYGIPVQQIGGDPIKVENKTVENEAGEEVDAPLKVEAATEVSNTVEAVVTPAEGSTTDVNVVNTTAQPVNTKEVNAANKAKKTTKK